MRASALLPSPESSRIEIRRYGEHAVLVDIATLDDVVRIHRTLSAQPPAGVIDIVPGPRSLLVRFNNSTNGLGLAAAIRAACHTRQEAHSPADTMPPVQIPIRYDGDDLVDVAATLGISVDEVRRRHLAPQYAVALIGMAPGFYFLSGSDPVFHTLGRHPSPRTSVPMGAIGIAGEFTGIYPRRGPGGWQLIANTAANLWDPTVLPAAKLAPGARIEFVESTL